MKSTLILSLFAVAFLVGGCKDDTPSSDSIKPKLSSLNFINGNSVMAGDKLDLRATFTDNMELSEVFFEIHENFAGHSHQKANLRHSDSKIVELTGTSDDVETTFEIPQNAASGPYHMEVSVLDAAGNRSDVKVFEFFITQNTQPVFTSIPTVINTTVGASFNVKFEVTDETDLKEITYEVVKHGSEGEEPLFEGDVDLDGADDKSFSFDQDFTASGFPTELEFIVRVFDNDDNLTLGVIEIEVE